MSRAAKRKGMAAWTRSATCRLPRAWGLITSDLVAKDALVVTAAAEAAAVGGTVVDF